jgi:hypothetical protein
MKHQAVIEILGRRASTASPAMAGTGVNKILGSQHSLEPNDVVRRSPLGLWALSLTDP